MGAKFYTAGGDSGVTRSDDKTEKRSQEGIVMETGKSMWQPGPNYGWVHTELAPDTVEYLWKIIRKGEEAQDEYKHRLAGNVSQSFGILDEDDYFQDTVMLPQVNIFRNQNGGSDPIRNFVQLEDFTPLRLTEFWVNYQYPGEFNPYHFHGGAYSFAIWMKIPYDWETQKELPQFQGTKIQDRKVGCFEFEYVDMLGGIRNFAYRLSPQFEGQMVFFPASLRHSVYPFFQLPGQKKEARVSIAGNLWYDTTGKGVQGNANTHKAKPEIYNYEEDAFKNKIDIKKKGKRKNKKGFSNL